MGFPSPDPQSPQALPGWTPIISATGLGTVCFTPSHTQHRWAWGSRTPGDGEHLSWGGQGRKVLAELWLLALGLGHLMLVPGLQPPGPALRQVSGTVMNCPSPSHVMLCPAAPVAQSQLPTQSEARALSGMSIIDRAR